MACDWSSACSCNHLPRAQPLLCSCMGSALCIVHTYLSSISHPPCPCCPADLFFMLLIMMGFAVAFHVLFRKDQKHEVSS